MIVELILATAMVAVTVVIHGWGLALLGVLAERDWKSGPLDWLSVRAIAFSVALILGLFVLHGVEIWLYAAVLHQVGAVESLRDAVYISTISYAAIGFSDVGIAEPWRLVAGIEGINGLLLIGWSTAFFVTIMNQIQLGARRRRTRRSIARED